MSGDLTFDGVAQENGETFHSGVFSFLGTGARGNAGDITIAGRSLSLTNGAVLESSTQGMGNAGKVSVRVDGDISLASLGSIFSTVESGAVGNGGTIDINSTTGSLKVTGGAELETLVRGVSGKGAGSTPLTSTGQGNAGNINIQVGKDITFDGVAQANGKTSDSAAYSFVGSRARGNGGNITIAAHSLSLTNGAQLASDTFGTGNAGIVSINARDGVSFEGAGINGDASGVYTDSSNNPGTNGQTGNITVTTTAFRLANSAAVSSQTSSPSDGGEVKINSTTFEATNGGQVLTRTASSGEAGNIILQAGAITLDHGFVSATAASVNGGNISRETYGLHLSFLKLTSMV